MDIMSHLLTTNWSKITEEAAEVISNKIAAGTKLWAVDIFPFRESRQVRMVKKTSEVFHSPIHPRMVPRGYLQAACRRMESGY